MFEAYKQVGKTQYGDEWMDGKELAARNADEIAQSERHAQDRPERVAKARKAAMGMVVTPSPKQIGAVKFQRNRMPQIFSNKKAEVAARERGDWAWDQLRQWLFAEIIPALIFDDQGQCHDVRNNTWAHPGAITILHAGQTLVDGAAGHVLLSQPHLESAIRGEEEVEPSQGPEKFEPSPIDKEPQPEISLISSPSEAHSQQAESPEPEAENDRREKQKRKTEEKHQHWLELSQQIKAEGKWTRPKEIASAIAKREKARINASVRAGGTCKDSKERGVNAENIRRRLDQHYPGWAR